MKKIRKYETKKLEKILSSSKEIKAFTFLNNYTGEEIKLSEKEIKSTLSDLKEGFALMYQIDDEHFEIKYAGKCKWNLTTE
jgi:polysaccharide deacetylase 2 family uncharacterized protein YibQ